jgi:hypothetical protein
LLFIRLITAVLLSALAISGCANKRMKPAIFFDESGRGWRGRASIISPQILAVLEQAEIFDIVSVDPRADGQGDFHGFRDLGRTRITDQNERCKLINAYITGVHEGGRPAACVFQPRHAIHCVKDGGVLDILICFRCTDVFVYDGEYLYSAGYTGGSSRPSFDSVLTAAGVPLADD